MLIDFGIAMRQLNNGGRPVEKTLAAVQRYSMTLAFP